ncbi:mannose-1-phosphate guanylyltransferase [Sphingosinicella terrae]|uniref:mannose-1-phosphate guanylyltransferase n=1 Tax=Sphingosinicella terrae TaxID=2172047 RepID=UPI000E0DB8D2|nr:sugar phosphate nucleotidyltransferase [Sphingosinicella terrae]
METPAAPITPVILCGGAGTRLWPLSRLDRPKPFVSIEGDESLLQATLSRVADPVRFAAPIVIAADEYGPAVEAQLAGRAPAGTRLVLEPVARGTAAAITLAALLGDPDALLLVLPSDHVVKAPTELLRAVAVGTEAAREGWLVTFGARPDRAETGYGYLRQGEAAPGGTRRVERFVEKPDAEAAAGFVADGAYLWNCGIFLFTAGALIEEMRKHAPYILAPCEEAVAGIVTGPDGIRPSPGPFARAPAQSIDHAVMERSDRVATVPVDMGWSDAGSWEALHAAAAKDSRGNALDGDVVAIDSDNSLIRSEGPLVVGVGIRDMVVVATERSVLIVPRGESQRVKEAVEALIRRGHAPPPELKEGEE